MNSAATAVAPRVRLYVVDPRKYKKLSNESTHVNASVEPPSSNPRFLLPKTTVVAVATKDTKSTDFLTVNARAVSIPFHLNGISVNGHGQFVQVETDKVTKSNTKKKKPRKRKTEWDSPRGETENDKKLKAFFSTEATTRVGRLSKNPPRFFSSQSETPATSTSSTIEPPPKIRIREPPEVFRCQACQKVYLGHTKLNLHYKTFPDHQIKNAAATATLSTPNYTHTSTASATQTTTRNVSRVKTHNSSVSVGIQVSFLPEMSALQRNEDGIANRRSSSELQSSVNMTRATFERPEFPFPSPSRSNNLLSDSILNLRDSVSQPSLEPITVPDLCLPNSLSPRDRESPRENGFNSPSSNGFYESAFSRFRVTSQNSYMHTSNSFPSPINNFPVTVSVPTYQPFTPPGENFHSSNDKAVTPVLKAIWEFIEDRMIQQGINQILVEISDAAERLSKIARDKFIPIREEEERLYCSSPIIQVDSPFLSHLLDLPFGTYVFREDAGVRIKPPPPPSNAELSLTGEVDVDKFVSPDILSLPHLTNIDFAAIL